MNSSQGQQMKKTEETKQTNTININDKIPFFSSLKFKITAMIIFDVVVTAIIMLMVIIPSMQDNMKEQTQNYLYDVTISNGAVLENLDDRASTDYDELKAVFANVGIEGVESSYAYVVDDEGIMLYHPTEAKVGESVENEVVKNLGERNTSGSTGHYLFI